jgi:uncharacterized membrane protein
MSVWVGSRNVDLTRVELSSAWTAAGWIVALPLLASALYRAPWQRFADGEQVHVWYGTLFTLIVLWSIQATVGEGFTFHLLGVAALTLIAGPALALIGSAVVVAILMLVKGGVWPSAAMAWCAMAALPVGVTWGTLSIAERRLPPNFFVYVFVVAFFGAALSLAAAGLAGALALTLGGGRPAGLVFGDYVPTLVTLAFGEATLVGMAMTLLIVYRPHWVATFDDARYIKGR